MGRSRSKSRSPSSSNRRHKRKHSSRRRSHSSDSDDSRRREKRRVSKSSKSRVHSNDKDKGLTSKSSMDEANFDIKKIKPLVDRMFFRDYDAIKKGTVQYDDFWKFYEKIQSIRRKGKINEKLDGKTNLLKKLKVGGKEIEVPEIYSKKYTVPFSLQYTDIEDYIYKLNPDDQEYVRNAVPKFVLIELLQTLLYFLDFLQKERFTKLKKLREAQTALPIANYRDAIIESLDKHNVLIIAGDTGCGKSTQVPQYLLKAGYTNIACTQPRRIACISLCKRVAYETLNEYGTQVGYQIRFEKRKTQHTKIVFVTEGLLLRQVSTDSMLTTHNVIVLDEVHERHLHGDFLLGIVKCLVYQRHDVKVILMSATINTKLFQDYFQGLAPIIQVPGRLYPIKMQYRPVSIEELSTKSGKLNPGPYVRILQLIDDKFPQDERGDVLIFLSGMTEISLVVEAAKMYAEVTKRWVILPLHSMLSIDDQDKVFDYPPEGVRKCIVATNIAETSITIDGIRFVVDSGKVKEMAYDPTCKLQRLKEFWISKASAEQRKGRAGRTGPGVCYRLYGESEYNELQPFSTPEIQRVPLDSLLLQMISIGIPDCRKFPFIEPPSLDSMESSIARLKEQDALTDDEQLTPIGKTLSQLPVDITLGKILIMGTLFEQVDAVLSLAAALSVQSPYTSWAHRDLDAVAARKSLDSDHGDPLTLLNAYRAWLEEKANDSSRTKKWCKRRGLEEQRFYEMTKLRQQFKSLLRDANLIKDDQHTSAHMSSSDRALRHGEVKQLWAMKREYHQAAPRKKKFLKLEDSEYGLGGDDMSDQETDAQPDIKDIEFRLRNDSSQVKDLLQKSTPYGYEDISMLKVILCSGLYPQLAISDDFNKFKNDADQMFHTKAKGFTLLHPTSVFANNTDVLRLTDSDIINVPHMLTKQCVSSRHQLLFYLTLLETNKPYLMNGFRVPAVQALFLFCHSIDIDPSFSRFVFDSWLEVEFADVSTARLMVITVAELRDTWINLLGQRLAEKDSISRSDLNKSRNLNRGLVSFLRTETFYSIKRLLAADQKNLYDRSSHLPFPEDEEFNLQKDWEIRYNMSKGGISLTSYMTYASLCGETPDPQEWACPICESSLMGMPLELLVHQFHCKRAKQKAKEEEIATEEEEIKARPFAKSYFCSICDRQLSLTPIEILRHKKTHSPHSSVKETTTSKS